MLLQAFFTRMIMPQRQRSFVYLKSVVLLLFFQSEGEVTFYDSNTGDALFYGPRGRS